MCYDFLFHSICFSPLNYIFLIKYKRLPCCSLLVYLITNKHLWFSIGCGDFSFKCIHFSISSRQIGILLFQGHYHNIHLKSDTPFICQITPLLHLNFNVFCLDATIKNDNVTHDWKRRATSLTVIKSHIRNNNHAIIAMSFCKYQSEMTLFSILCVN